MYTSVYVDALLILSLSRRSIDKYNGCFLFMAIFHSEFEWYVANMNKNGSIVSDKGPGQQVDGPQPLLLLLLCTLRLVGKIAQLFPRLSLRSIKFNS